MTTKRKPSTILLAVKGFDKEPPMTRRTVGYFKQFLCDVIVKLWPMMPRRLKLWAFLNDHLETIENERTS